MCHFRVCLEYGRPAVFQTLVVMCRVVAALQPAMTRYSDINASVIVWFEWISSRKSDRERNCAVSLRGLRVPIWEHPAFAHTRSLLVSRVCDTKSVFAFVGESVSRLRVRGGGVDQWRKPTSTPAAQLVSPRSIVK